MEKKGCEIDLSGHHSPAEFFADAEKRFSGGIVKLFLVKGTVLRVEVAEEAPLQAQVDVFSFLQGRLHEDAAMRSFFRK